MRHLPLRQLGALWLVAIIAAVVLVVLGLLRSPTGWDFAIALPSPVTPNALWGVLGQVFAARPLEATAVILIPGFALAGTVASLAMRYRSSTTGSKHR